MTTLAVRVPDATLARLDALVGEGQYANRTAAVRRALDALLAYEERRAIDKAIVDGYTRIPADPPDEFVIAMAERMIAEEPW